MAAHEMVITERTDAGTVFGCTTDGCGRRVVLHAGGGRTVLDRGDEWVAHHGGLGVVVRSAAG